MDKWDTLIALGVAGAIAAHEWKHPGVEHIQYEDKGGPDRPIGRSAVFTDATTMTIMPSVESLSPGFAIYIGK